ncbi:MAG: hypothetical protein R6U17_02715 [Thermoplasmata archaeon]
MIFGDPYYESRYGYSMENELVDLKRYAGDLKKELEISRRGSKSSLKRNR